MDGNIERNWPVEGGGGVDKWDIGDENNVGNDLEMTTKNRMNEEAAMPPHHRLIYISGFEFWRLTIKNAVFD